MTTSIELAISNNFNDDSNDVHESVTPREDQVTVQSEMPEWLVKDPYVQEKWNFKISRFKVNKYVNEPELHDPEELENWSWIKFNSRVLNIATKIYFELNKVYKNGISSIFRWKISTLVSLTFPELELIYEKFCQRAAEETIPGVKKTTFNPATFAVILMDFSLNF